MDKENFIKQLQKKVRLHGQQTFYAITYQDQVVSIFEHYHKFTVEDVIAHHEFRCEESDVERLKYRGLLKELILPEVGF